MYVALLMLYGFLKLNSRISSNEHNLWIKYFQLDDTTEGHHGKIKALLLCFQSTILLLVCV